MTTPDQVDLEVYKVALKEYKRAQDRLAAALQTLNKVGVFPSPPEALRYHLEDERPGTTHKFEIGRGEDGLEGYITTGLYTDDKVGEIFIVAEKEGTFVSGLLDEFATLTSMALQSGIPLETLITKFKFDKFEPAGMTKNPQIRMTTSVIDYLMRWLELKYTDQTGEPNDR